MIALESITDPLFTKLDTDPKDVYFAAGESKYLALCTEYGIDNSLIPTTIPDTPARIQTVCVLICVARDLIGSEWRQVREGLTIDVYQAKLNSLNDELEELKRNFTPSMCGYTDPETEDTSSSVSFQWGRA